MQLLPILLTLPLLGSAHPGCPAPRSKGAAYFLDNNPSGSSIVALRIGSDGLLSNPVRTSTGGKGLYGLTASMTGDAPAAGGAGMFVFLICFDWFALMMG